MVQKEVIVLGDVEMGAGNLTDDFISDNALCELIDELEKRAHNVDLVLNGDIFDFLKCPYFRNNQLSYTRHVTEEISLSKLNLIYKAHQRVFYSLRKFVKKRKNKLYFIIGNHDMDLVFKEIQNKIREFLGKKRNIYFKHFYNQDKIYIEHGQQYDFLNRFNKKRLFLKHKKDIILNQSWVSFSLMSKFMDLKEQHPFLERITPRPSLMDLHKDIVKKLTWRGIVYFLKSTFYYPFRYFFDPTYFYPRELVKDFYRRLRKAHYDLDNIIKVFKLTKRRTYKKSKIVVLGHIHEKFIEDKRGRVIIHPGSWRDEYHLDKESRKLVPIPKRYVQIIVEDENINYQLIEYPLKREEVSFDKAIKNEIAQIKKAAFEEGFTSGLI